VKWTREEENEQEQVVGKITSRGKGRVKDFASFGRVLNNFDKVS
jgi:hypothetical protein